MPDSGSKSQSEIEAEREYYKHGDNFMGSIVLFILLSTVGSILWVAFNATPVHSGLP